MPELPEVQTIVSDLQTITGETITGFWSDWKKAIRNQSKKNIPLPSFVKQIIGKKITAVLRIGKSIAIDLSDGNSLLIHLRMTGKLILVKSPKPASSADRSKVQSAKQKHLHHIFYLKKNERLEFHDVRKFATITLLSTEKISERFALSGIDPLDKKFSFSLFQKKLTVKPNKPIKELLMDQALFLGIGNIYASEILFWAKVLPQRKAADLTTGEQKLIYRFIGKILSKAIKLRGTSVSDYRDSQGKKGSFQNELAVYRRNKQKCKKCATMIERIVIAQRSSFYCPGCQK